MKEFYKTQKVTYNLMSFTGFKALLIFSMLTEGPKSYEEICSRIENNPYLKEKFSIDTMRVYINSLKRIGCEVKRTKGDDKISRYMITAHPFEFKLSPEQIQSIIKVYKSLVKNMDIKDIIYMDKFLEKIGNYIKNEDFIYSIKSLSMMKDINRDLLEELIECCDNNLQIIMRYNSPNSGEKDIEIITDKIEISNGKIYLKGLGFEYNQVTSFPISRIKKILEIKQNKTVPNNIPKIKVSYELEIQNYQFEPTDYEKIIKQDGNKIVVEAITTNPFFLKQRLLQFGPACKIIGPNEFKNEFIQLLKDMKAGYYNA